MIRDELFESPQQCPECGGISFSDLILAEKKDACYHKVKASAKVWPSAYASGRLVQCRKKGAANYGNKSESIEEQSTAQGTVGDVNTSGAKSLTIKALGKVGRAFMPTLGFTDAAERLSNKDYTGAGISAAAGGIGLIPAWPAQVASGGLELVNMTRDEANALGGYDKLAKEISKNFTSEYDPSYLPENPTQSEGIGTLYNRGKDFVKYLRRDSGITSQDIATGRNVGGKAIPSLGEPGKVVTSPTADKALTKLGGKNVETTPGPTVKSGSSNDLNLDPVFDVPAYVRQGKSDPVTVPKPGSKPTIKIQPGETMIQAMQRAKDEQEFGKFLQGQGGQKFGNPNAAQATSGPGQVPTIRLPDGSLIVDPYRLSPSGQYNTPPDSEMDKIMKKWDQENNPAKSKGQLPWGGNIEPNPSVGSSSPKLKNKSSKWLQSLGGGTDKKTVDEQSVAPATNAPTLRSAQGQAAGTAPRGLTPQQQTAFAPHLKTDAATGSQYYDTPDTDPKEVGAMMGTKITTPAAQALVKSPQGQAGVIKHLTAVTDPKNTVNPATTKTTPLSPADAAAAVPDSQPASEGMHRLRELSGLANKDIEEQSRKKREQPEVKYDDEYDAMVARVKKLAGLGPLKTVYDPKKRQYRNMPTAQQPKK